MSDSLRRAGRAVEAEGETPWASGEGAGARERLGSAPRRALRRALRSERRRQHELDREMVEALRAIAAGLESTTPGLTKSAGGLPDGIAEGEAEAGSFWVREDDALVGGPIREHGKYGLDISRYIEGALREGDTFVDVGANIGYFSVLASPLVGPRGRVVAVEPDPANLPLLRANLWRNGCANARVLPVAAWNERGHLRLLPGPEGGATSEVVGSGEGPGPLVPAAPLDDLLGGRVDLVKVDAQMTDHLAIAGAEGLLRANPGVRVVAEFDPPRLRERGHDPAEILAGYERLGFALHVLGPYVSVERMDAGSVLAHCERPDVPFVDLVLERP